MNLLLLRCHLLLWCHVHWASSIVSRVSSCFAAFLVVGHIWGSWIQTAIKHSFHRDVRLIVFNGVLHRTAYLVFVNLLLTAYNASLKWRLAHVQAQVVLALIANYGFWVWSLHTWCWAFTRLLYCAVFALFALFTVVSSPFEKCLIWSLWSYFGKRTGCCWRTTIISLVSCILGLKGLNQLIGKVSRFRICARWVDSEHLLGGLFSTFFWLFRAPMYVILGRNGCILLVADAKPKGIQRRILRREYSYPWPQRSWASHSSFVISQYRSMLVEMALSLAFGVVRYHRVVELVGLPAVLLRIVQHVVCGSMLLQGTQGIERRVS